MRSERVLFKRSSSEWLEAPVLFPYVCRTKSHITDEVKLVAQPVGTGDPRSRLPPRLDPLHSRDVSGSSLKQAGALNLS